jgi:hypothetical protein
LSDSEYRNESNGVLLFNRYKDGDNLYYSGIRVDGQAVIKKKIKGKYFTLVEKELFGKDGDYDRKSNPNLIPQGKWIGIKSVLKNEGEAVDIKLYVDEKNKRGIGSWH